MKIAFLGDIALIGKYDIQYAGETHVFSRLEWIKSVLKDCDYVVANLESPLTDIKNTREAKSMPLRSGKENVRVLEYLGVNAVSLANNHIYDYGEKGLLDTTAILTNSGIKYFGIDRRPLLIKEEKIAIQGFCCYTANGWHYDSSLCKGRLNALTVPSVDRFLRTASCLGYYPIAFPHWGEENTHYPQLEHVILAGRFLKSGTCSLVGHHPHVPQGIIYKNNGVCAFSLGNLIFDDCYSPKNGVRVIQSEDNKKGYILILDIQDNELTDSKIICYHDAYEGIRHDAAGEQKLKEYSDVILNISGTPEYEQLRRDEKQKARLERLGKRDLRWLVNHLNLNSVLSVLHGKSNHKNFIKVMDSVSEQDSSAPSRWDILYVGNFGLPKTNAPGKRVFANSCLFARAGFKVLMIGTEPTSTDAVQNLGENIGYVSFPSYGKSKGKKYFQWLKHFMDVNIGKPNVIVRYGSPGLAFFDKHLERYARKNDISIIVDVVDWLNADAQNLLLRFVKWIDTYLEKGIFNKSGDGLIAISTYLYEYYSKYYRNKIVLPPLVCEYAVREPLNHSQAPQFVYAGDPFRRGGVIRNVHAVKDRLDIAVGAFLSLESRHTPFDFHVIGLTKDEFLVAFPRFKDGLNKTKHIHFYGRLPMEKAQKMVAAMDFSVLLREKNRATMAGFPTKVVESMSLGVPVITTNTSDLAEYIIDGVNGYIVDIGESQSVESRFTEIADSYKDNVDEMKRNLLYHKSFLIDCYENQFNEFITNVLCKQ